MSKCFDDGLASSIMASGIVLSCVWWLLYAPWLNRPNDSTIPLPFHSTIPRQPNAA